MRRFWLQHQVEESLETTPKHSDRRGQPVFPYQYFCCSFGTNAGNNAAVCLPASRTAATSPTHARLLALWRTTAQLCLRSTSRWSAGSWGLLRKVGLRKAPNCSATRPEPGAQTAAPTPPRQTADVSVDLRATCHAFFYMPTEGI